MRRAILDFIRRVIGTNQITSHLSLLDARLSGVERRLSETNGSNQQPRTLEELRAEIKNIREDITRVAETITGIGAGLTASQSQLAALRQTIATMSIDTSDALSDVLLLVHRGDTIQPVSLSMHSDRAVAGDSPDHLEPRGTKNDNTRHPRFVRRCEELLPTIVHMDLGCAGTGLVWDFTLRGHISVGVEGSDYNPKEQRAEWRVIPDRLFTADICHPYQIKDRNGQRLLFNLVTAWELFEHIPTDKVDDVISHIIESMTDKALLVCSVATFVDRDAVTGTVYHQTVKPKEWWVDRFARQGLREVSGLFETADFVRGAGNPRASDWDVRRNPEMGFHLTLQR